MTYMFLTKTRIRFLLLGLVLVLSFGCRKEEITTIYEEEIEDPKLIDKPVAKGTISYGGALLAGVNVEVYQDGKLAGSILTDQNGKFNTQPIDLIPNKDVTLYCKKEGFVPTPRRFQGQSNDHINILLLPQSETIYNPNPLNNASSSNLIVLRGKVVNGLGGGEIAKGLAIYNVTKNPFGVWTYDGASFETASDGSFEILVPKGQELYYQIKQEGCYNGVLTKPIFKLFDETPAEIIGPFYENTELPTVSNNITDGLITRSVKLLMNPRQCQNNTLIQYGRIEWLLKVGTQTKTLTTQLLGKSTKDEFLFCLNETEKDYATEVNYTVYDDANKMVSTTTNFQTSNTYIYLGDIIPCNPIGFSFELTIDGVLYQSDIANFADQVNAGIDQDNLTVPILYSNTQNRWIRFNIPNVTQPNPVIKDFRYLGNNGYYYQKNQEIKCTITSFANKTISGTLEGQVEDDNNNSKVVPISGKFNFRYQ